MVSGSYDQGETNDAREYKVDRYCGGIGEMIAGYLTQRINVRMSFINVGEQFGEVGNIDYLCNTFGFTVDNIVCKAITLMK